MTSVRTLPQTSDVGATILRIDSAISEVSGAAMVLLSGPLSELTGLSATFVLIVGLVALGYGAILWMGARNPATVPATLKFAVIANDLWVLASIALLLFANLPLTAFGVVFVIAITAVVGALGIAQWRVLRTAA